MRPNEVKWLVGAFYLWLVAIYLWIRNMGG
jgi:hypothetical protein